MRSISAGASLLACALAIIFPGAPAEAQNVGEGGGSGGDNPVSRTAAPPAERLAVAPGGVDMRTGRYNFSQTDLSIGEDNETGGLALTRSLGTDAIGHISPLGNFSHNYDIFVDLQLVPLDPTGSTHADRARVHFGGRSETFEMTGNPLHYEQVSRSGYALLTFSGAVYTFTSNDGTVAVFRPFAGTSDCSTAWACAYVSTITYADGTRFTFEYDPPTTAATAHLRQVTSNRGYALLLQYGSGADANYVTSACVVSLAAVPAPASHACPASRATSASYTYTTLGSARRLASATDAGNGIWGYAYAASGNGFTMAFTRPDDSGPWLTNTVWVRPTMDSIDEVIVHQAFADSGAYSYAYDFSPQVDGEIPQLAGGQYIDPAGNTTTVTYDFPPRPGSMNPPRVNGQGYPYVNYGDVIFQITPGPVSITDPLQRVTRYDYCDPYAATHLPSYEHNRCLVMPMPVSFTEPDGRRTDLIWDMTTRNLGRSTRHALAGSGLGDIVTSATYNCPPTTMAICTKPTTTTDARSYVTDYTYDTTHGGLLSVTGPAPAAGAPRPQTRHTYAQRYAWIANGAGGYVMAPTPIWVRTSTSTCRTSAATGNPAAPCAAGALDEVLTTYDYGPDSGPNTLLLRGQAVTAEVGGSLVTSRTCYGYDARGRRISETQPNANLGSCP
jgi:hypothetical protein